VRNASIIRAMAMETVRTSETSVYFNEITQRHIPEGCHFVEEIFRYSYWGCAYANGFAVLAEGFDTFRLGAIATGGNMNPSRTLSFRKRTVVG
jgi:hypothetical protein